MKKLLFIITTIAVFTSCKKEETITNTIDPNAPIHQSYRITYNNSKKTTTVWSIFSQNDVSGNNLKLDGQAGILINNETPTPGKYLFLPELNYFQYESIFEGINDVNIKLKKPNGELIENEFKNQDRLTINFESDEIVISKKEGAKFNWTGNESNDRDITEVKLEIYGETRISNYQIKKLVNKNIILTPDDFKNFNVGETINLELTRTKKIKLPKQDGSAEAIADIQEVSTKKVLVVD